MLIRLRNPRLVDFNPNPRARKGTKRWNGQDCPIRAISAITGLDWTKIYKMLCETGLEVLDAPTSDRSVEKLLKKLGFVKHGIKVLPGSTRPTVNSFADQNKGVYLLRVSHHMVGIRDGHIYDTGDCGDCSVYSYYCHE